MNAIDTNVLAYLFDPTAPTKQAQARRLVDDLVQKKSGTVLPWQVAVELLACLKKAEKKGLVTTATVRDDFREVLRLLPVRYPTTLVFERAFSLQDRFSLSYWDSLLVGA